MSRIDQLNQGAEQVLRGIVDVGKRVDRNVAEIGRRVQKPLGFATDLAGYDSLRRDVKVAQYAKRSRFDIKIAAKIVKDTRGVLSKGVNFAGSVLNAATGVGDAVRELGNDMEKGDKNYTGFMKSMLKSVGQTSAGYLATGAVATALGLSSLPFLATVGVAAAGGFLAGKAIDYLAS